MSPEPYTVIEVDEEYDFNEVCRQDESTFYRNDFFPDDFTNDSEFERD